MSNTRDWRAKSRTETPNSRQKRNGLFLDAHPNCGCGARSEEAHHDLPKGNRNRYDWQHMKALCQSCHVALHQNAAAALVIRFVPTT